MSRVIRISSESGPAFRRAFIATVSILALLCAGVAALNFLHGPKLESAQVDLARVVAAPAQQLRLFANQPVASVNPKQVTITPAAAFTVSVAADVIAVQFTEPLDYDTAYRVTVDGVTNTFDDQAATLDYGFRTGAPKLYYLDRGIAGADDRIVRAGLTGAGQEVVYSAPGIQEFVRVGELLAVAVAGADESGATVSAVRLVSLTDGGVETLNLPAAVTVGELHATDSASVLGFTVTSAGDPLDGDYDRALFTVDLAAGRTLVPVAGLDGEPLEVASWLFVPGTTDVVAQTRDDSVVRSAVDSSGATAIVPLGQFDTVTGISTDGALLTVTDRYGSIALDLATQKQVRLPPSDFEGKPPYGGEAIARGDGSRVQHIAVFDEATGRFASYLVLDDGAASRVLYRTVDDTGEIGRFTLSPNNQFVAAEIVPDVSARESDGNALNPRATTVTTVIVDVESGALVRSVDGFALGW